MTQTNVSFYYYILPLKKGMPYNNKKITKWDLIKLNKVLYRKENHKQNEKITYELGENTCKRCDQQGLNLQNIQTAYRASLVTQDSEIQCRRRVQSLGLENQPLAREDPLE